MIFLVSTAPIAARVYATPDALRRNLSMEFGFTAEQVGALFDELFDAAYDDRNIYGRAPDGTHIVLFRREIEIG